MKDSYKHHFSSIVLNLLQFTLIKSAQILVLSNNFRILHLCITLAFHFTILKDMEKMAGWHRIAIIYIFSGIGGNLLSAIVTPYQPEVRYLYFVSLIYFVLDAYMHSVS